MTFNKFIDRLERLIDAALYLFRGVFPRRPAWFKLASICILGGISLFSSSWWVPLVLSAFDLTVEAFGMRADGFSLLTSPEFYGGVLIVSGIVIGVLFGFVVGETLRAEPFVGSAADKGDTFLTLADFASRKSGLPLDFENVERNDLMVEVPEGPFQGIDCARALRALARRSGNAFLKELHIVQTKDNIIIGKAK
ncbi:hypothetical protein [Neorhizobium sp. DAR64860/K0K1]|uniref:hypothetical protein n=1 Tax=Neorhizobium sp. DAR64860/K0K1 TaxID=3421955 RepID=UPI003D2935DF